MVSTPPPRRPTPRRAAFTLVEAAISMVIIAVMVVAALETVGAAAKARALTLDRRIGSTLSHDLMAEVLQNAYVEPIDTPNFGRESGESGGSRANYDDVDDYDGWSESPPVTKADATIPGFSGWSRAVTVRQVVPATMTVVGSSTDTGLKQITVTVTSPSGKKTTLQALRAKAGGYDAAPPTDTTSVEWIGIRMQIGANAPTLITGVDLLNQPPQ